MNWTHSAHLMPDPMVTTGFVRQQNAQNSSFMQSIDEQVKARDAAQMEAAIGRGSAHQAFKPMKTREEIESKLADFERWLETDAQRFELDDRSKSAPLNAAVREALRWVLGREAALEPED